MNFDPQGEVDLIASPDLLDELDGYDLLAHVHQEARSKIQKIVDNEEVIDLVFRLDSTTDDTPPHVRAGLLFPFGNTLVRLDGSTTTGTPAFSRDLSLFSPSFSFDDLLTRSHHLVTDLGGENLVRKAIRDRPEAPLYVALAITRTGSVISEITLVAEQPVSNNRWWQEAIESPIDVVWSDRLDHSPKEAIEALTRVLDRNGDQEHVQGSVLAELTGSPVEWVRAFFDGSSES